MGKYEITSITSLTCKIYQNSNCRERKICILHFFHSFVLDYVCTVFIWILLLMQPGKKTVGITLLGIFLPLLSPIKVFHPVQFQHYLHFFFACQFLLLIPTLFALCVYFFISLTSSCCAPCIQSCCLYCTNYQFFASSHLPSVFS